MKKSLTYFSFLITSLLVILAFVTATTYIQLGIAIALYPLIALFAYKLFVVRDTPTPLVPMEPAPIFSESVQKTQQIHTSGEGVKVSDIDKRAFLKLIGATGISFFLFSLFNKRTGVSLFPDSTGPGVSTLTDNVGNKINPAEREPIDGYQISEIDYSDISYYGFINKNGAWYIMKEDEEGSFRYIKGTTDFPTNWADRTNLSYDYYHTIFL